MVEVKKGQSMGLMPSFPLFALSHNFILTAICKWHGKVPVETFRVLGDDLVIADDMVHSTYVEFCRDYELPLSVHKCLESTHTGEFAGRVIHKGQDVTPIRWKMLGGEQLPALFYDYRAVLGDSVYRLISDKNAFLTLGSLPKSVGGLGICGFDTNHVPISILKARVGLAMTRLENLGLPALKGETLYLSQEPLGDLPEYLPGVNMSYLRGLSKLLEKDKVWTEWGQLPYLGPPGQVSRQLGVEIPLLPKIRPADPWNLVQRYIRRYYHASGADSRRREKLLERLTSVLYEYSERLQELKLKQSEESTSKESPRAQEVRRTFEEFVPGLFYE
jgi:hypothetical protein